MTRKQNANERRNSGMQAKAVAKSVRIAPRKVRLVIDLIRGKNVGEAIAILRHTQRGASPVVEKVLNSAIANAEHNYEMDPDNLIISEVYVNEGATLKRFRPRAQGRASKIIKRVFVSALFVTGSQDGMQTKTMQTYYMKILKSENILKTA